MAADLAKKEIKGLSDLRVLRDCRVLYRVYPQIRGSAARELPAPLALQELMRLSWTHLQELIRLNDPLQRAFYENECIKSR